MTGKRSTDTELDSGPDSKRARVETAAEPNTADATDDETNSSSSSTREWKLNEAIDLIRTDQCRAILREFAPQLESLRDGILKASEEETNRRLSIVKTFDHLPEQVWRIFNVPQELQNPVYQNKSAYQIVHDAFNIPSDEVYEPSSFQTRKNAITTMLKIAEIIVRSESDAAREVMEEYAKGVDYTFTDGFLNLAESFSNAEKKLIMNEEEDGKTFAWRLGELRSDACYSGSTLWPELRRSRIVLEEYLHEEKEPDDMYEEESLHDPEGLDHMNEEDSLLDPSDSELESEVSFEFVRPRRE
ncbi:hypothetical protein IWZ01DRAFT_542095 [Phyllosticta capitalensis]